MPAPVPPAFPWKPTAPVTTATGERAPEWINIAVWRYEELRRAGYPAHLAMDMAESRDVDLHQACQLLAQGCSPERAVAILT